MRLRPRGAFGGAGCARASARKGQPEGPAHLFNGGLVSILPHAQVIVEGVAQHGRQEQGQEQEEGPAAHLLRKGAKWRGLGGKVGATGDPKKQLWVKSALRVLEQQERLPGVVREPWAGEEKSTCAGTPTPTTGDGDRSFKI